MEERRIFRRGTYIYLALSLLFLIAAACLYGVILFKGSSLQSQTGAERWSQDSRFSQISVFLSSDAVLREDSLLDINKGLERKLKEASALPSEGTGRAYVLSYSSETQLNISSNKADVQTNVVITGGDFFKFHPMKLLSGYYFTESDLNYDRIVIDDNLAWQLYGSYDVDGMKVYIAEKPFIIAAVVKSDYNIVSKEIYGDKPRAYISFDAMQIILESETYVTCFEAILPEPINGFGIGAVKEIISSDEKLIEYVQNTGRYSFITLLRKLGNMSTLSARKTNVIPPYWENDARILDIRLAIILFFSLMSTLIPLSFIVFLLISVFRRRKIYFNDIKRIASEKFERISQNRKGK